MSSMLEEAILDAQALREAAIQSAEQAVLARYSEQIKGTVDSLLEQDDMGLGGLGGGEQPKQDQGASYGGPATATDQAAAADKDNKSIVEDRLDKFEGKAYAFGDLSPNKNFELTPDQEIEIDLQKIVAESKNLIKVDESELKSLVEDDSIQISESELEDLAGLNEELEVDEAQLGPMMQEVFSELAEEGVLEEKIQLDFEAKPSGWMGAPTKVLDEESMLDILSKGIANMEMELAKEHKNIVAGLNGKITKLNENLTRKTNEKERLQKEIAMLYETVESLKTRFDEMTLINAKLLYTNKVLSDDAFNSRQKNEIVESIQTADSVEKAKLVYETLQSAVGTRSSGPKSLSEAVDRRTNTSVILRSVNQTSKTENLNESFANRMKTLAGINN